MTCNGCRGHVEQILRNVKGVTSTVVDLEKAEATIEMNSHISIDIFQKALEKDTNRYKIHKPGECNHQSEVKKKKPKGEGTGTFYCPMHCEEDKTYDQLQDCPICGMDLVEEIRLIVPIIDQYTCPMHPEVVKDVLGSCPICGIDLVVLKPDLSVEEKNYKKLLRKFWIAILFTLPIFIIAMSEMLYDNPLYKIIALKHWNWIQLGLSIPVVFYAAWMFFERAFRSIKTWNLNMFTLIGIGAGVAWLFSVFGIFFPDLFPNQFKTATGTVHIYFEAATVILTLVLFGQVLEARAHSKTNAAIKELLKLIPNKAIRIIEEKEEEISIDQIELNDILRVKPGDKIPVDGVLVEGQTTVDESMITGESALVNKIERDQLISGTINGNQSFLMKTEKIGSDTVLSQIIKMVNDASHSRVPIQKLADIISGYFVPVVVVIALITFAIWVLYGPEPSYVYALVNAIAVLIIACPCAIGLATPMSVMVGVGKGAQNGVLIKNAEAFETLSKVDVLIVDKTGTITEGKPTVEIVEALGEHFQEKEIIQYIISLNNLSKHPLAQATLKYGREQNIEFLKVFDFESVTGKGVKGNIAGKKMVLGNIKMMKSNDISIASELIKRVQSYQKKGKTVSYLSIDTTIVGYIVIGDKVKENSMQAITELQDKGIDILMFTGDNYDTAFAVASELNLTNFKADMLPEDKLREVEKLQQQGKVVAMAGDGINDAPALAKSDVGIAMGTGTDVAIESANITLVKGDVQGIVKAKKISDKVMKNIKQNLFLALIYNSIGVPIAAGVLFPFFGIVLSPMIAALAMSFSSVSVIANALRLRTIHID